MEIWDLYTKYREKTGKEHVRGKQIPKGYYHLVVHVWIRNKKGEYLISQRAASRQAFPLMWECVGGSVLKGETAKEGARRELQEETGICVELEELLPVYTEVSERNHTIYCCFAVKVKKQGIHIKLQDGETVAWKFLPYPQWKDFLKSEETAKPIRNRYSSHENDIEKILLGKPA